MSRWNKGLVLFALALWLGGPTVSDSEGSDDRIVGGSVTAAVVFPWQAAVVLDASRFSGTDAQRQFCGGTLLTSRVVQTAAHCIADTDPDGPGAADPNDIDVVLGRTTLSSEEGERLDVQALYVSPDFSPATNANDFAWIVLEADASLGSTEQTIQVAGPDEAALWAPGAPTRVSGWGNTVEGGNSSDQLNQALVPIVEDSRCDDTDVYGTRFKVESMVCAGLMEGGADSCQGDSGGPLVSPVEGGGYRLVGIVSWGTGCARASKPGVYSRIAALAGLQGRVDQIEAEQGLPDGGSVIGSGGIPAINPPEPGTGPASSGPAFGSGPAGASGDRLEVAGAAAKKAAAKKKRKAKKRRARKLKKR